MSIYRKYKYSVWGILLIVFAAVVIYYIAAAMGDKPRSTRGSDSNVPIESKLSGSVKAHQVGSKVVADTVPSGSPGSSPTPSPTGSIPY